MDRLEKLKNGIDPGNPAWHFNGGPVFWCTFAKNSRIYLRGWLIERARTAALRRHLRLYEDMAPAEVVDRVDAALEARRG